MDGWITRAWVRPEVPAFVIRVARPNAVICGGILAGCHEALGEVMEIGGKSYGQYRGMGSMAAGMKTGSAARYGHTSDGTRNVAPECVETLKEVSGSVDRVALHKPIGGLQSGLWLERPTM